MYEEGKIDTKDGDRDKIKREVTDMKFKEVMEKIGKSRKNDLRIEEENWSLYNTYGLIRLEITYWFINIL